jgi:hypothetical protein
MLEPIPFAGMVEIDESFDRTASHMAGEYVSYNETVAWIDEETGCFVYSQYDYEDLDEHGKDGLIPLYTHPAKTLTDAEILDLCPPNHSDMMNEAYTIDFARALLKKAQEK